jgi:hypothetical protein
MLVGCVVGNDRVAVIDSGHSSEMASSMVEHIRRITDRPIAYVVNTNSQPHRILGNATFRQAGTKIVAAVPRINGDGPALAGRAEEIPAMSRSCLSGSPNDHHHGPNDRGSIRFEPEPRIPCLASHEDNK